MVLAITPGEEWVWIHESDQDKPEDEQTRFRLRVLSSRQNAWVENKYAGTRAPKRGQKGGDDAPAIDFRTGDYRRAAIQAGLVEVENLQALVDGRVELVPWKTVRKNIGGEMLDVVAPDFLDRIPAEVQIELASAITDGPSLGDLDRKN